MTIVKWKKPYTNGTANSPAIFNSPFPGLFENFFGDDFLTREYASYVPAVNISEEDDKYKLELSAPGFEKEDFKIELKKGMLTISGEHKTEKETKEKTFSRKEFSYGSFQRSFSLPEGINEDAVDAKYENGILKISLAKWEDPKKAPREIKVS
ncbi:MAG: Hsp20/alpha crystallin family protein [Bacteroidia bacterium]|jgi:HSP20 family protein